MAQTADTDLTTEANVIGNETVAGANTADRIRDMLVNVIDSKINNDKIDTDNALATASKTLAGRDAVKAYIASLISTEVTNRNSAISTAINNLIDSSPGALDTLNELAAALGDDANFASTVTTALGLRELLSNKSTNTTLGTSNTLYPTENVVKVNLETTSIVSVLSAVALDATAFNKIHLITGVSANYTITLPTAVGNDGKMISFKGSGDFTLFDKEVTIDGLNLEKLDTRASFTISTGGYMTIVARSNNWDVLTFAQGGDLVWSTTYGGFSANPVQALRYILRSGTMRLMCTAVTNGTSDATTGTTFTMTMPAGFTAKYNQRFDLTNYVDGGTSATTTSGVIYAAAGSNILTLYKTVATGGWTNSGGKNASFNIDVIISA